MDGIQGLIAIALAAAGLYLLGKGLRLLHRWLLNLESKGYIFYTKNDGTLDRAGIAMLEMQSMLEPGKRHVVEMKKEQLEEMRNAGGPPLLPRGNGPPEGDR